MDIITFPAPDKSRLIHTRGQRRRIKGYAGIAHTNDVSEARPIWLDGTIVIFHRCKITLPTLRTRRRRPVDFSINPIKDADGPWTARIGLISTDL